MNLTILLGERVTNGASEGIRTPIDPLRFYWIEASTVTEANCNQGSAYYVGREGFEPPCNCFTDSRLTYRATRPGEPINKVLPWYQLHIPLSTSNSAAPSPGLRPLTASAQVPTIAPLTWYHLHVGYADHPGETRGTEEFAPTFVLLVFPIGGLTPLRGFARM